VWTKGRSTARIIRGPRHRAPARCRRRSPRRRGS
jgi:hypothetical protein